MTSSPFHNQTVLITGGTGTFGRAMTKALLKQDEVKKVIILSRDEWKQWDMRQSDPLFTSPKIRYFLGDVRDLKRLKLAFREVDIVIHAAALKQVPAAEYNPSEFILTNINGAMNVIDAALDEGVKKVLALSSDKSVNPINLYGATKLCSDKLFIAANSYVGARKEPIFSCVRYGNVLGSRGSILPKWKAIFEKGEAPLTLTHPDMTRFWLTIDQAVQFVATSIAKMRGKEIFIPKAPTIKTKDLAEAIAPGYPTKVIGIRDGEKLHETLVSPEESRFTFDQGDRYLILPFTFNMTLEEKEKMRKDLERKVPEGFSYRSDTNPHQLTLGEIKDFIASIQEG